MTGPEPFHLAVSVLLLLGPCLLYYRSVYEHTAIVLQSAPVAGVAVASFSYSL